MLAGIKIYNYKSIRELEVGVGQFNVLIGENGAGKSNFLEVLASGSAIIANKFSNEFMLSRGIRIVNPDNLFSCFNNKMADNINITNVYESGYGCVFNIKFNKDEPFAQLESDLLILHRNLDLNDDLEIVDIKDFNNNFLKDKIKDLAETTYGSVESLLKNLNEIRDSAEKKEKDTKNDIKMVSNMVDYINTLGTIQRTVFDKYYSKNETSKESNFVIFSPELSSLRNFSSESQIEPLGINGEGLFKLLQVMQQHEQESFLQVCETLEMFQWVEKIIVDDQSLSEQKVRIIDRFMGREIDHRSANEGFLFVLFYAALFSSKYTPDFFAIDNIDASLNPKLCRVLIKKLVELAKANKKQVFVTTHNPAILDGLDLKDDQQRLFKVERDDDGATQLKRINIEDLPKPKRNGETLRLSEAFMRGLLGGLPTNF